MRTFLWVTQRRLHQCNLGILQIAALQPHIEALPRPQKLVTVSNADLEEMLEQSVTDRGQNSTIVIIGSHLRLVSSRKALEPLNLIYASLRSRGI
jgi:hypothetical protein